MYTGFCWYKDKTGKQDSIDFQVETAEEIQQMLDKGVAEGWREYKLKAVDPNDINKRVTAAQLYGLRKFLWDYFSI